MIKVLASSFGLSLQDSGRYGYASYGVPSSGAMDQYSSKLANKLLNNAEDDAVLEITNGGCKLLFESTTCICLTGADYSAKLDGKPAELNRIIKVDKGSVLSFGARKFGFRTYLAVKNGFQTESSLGSKSMYPNITSPHVLKKGDILRLVPFTNDKKNAAAKVKIELEHFKAKALDCYQGPEFESLNSFQHKQLFDNEFQISPNNNRMGYQLENGIENSIPQMLTSSVLPGTVQLTPSGKLIILMRDCQVTGGYPRVLQLSEHSINRLAQKTTRDVINFNLTG